MTPFKTVSEEEIQRINRLQQSSFDKIYKLFEPPLPEGVPERLEKIVAHGKITKAGSFSNLSRMIKANGRLVISHQH